MGMSTSVIDTAVTNPELNAVLAEITPDDSRRLPSCRFSQNEDQFLVLDQPVEIPAFPVHHDFQDRVPPEGYANAIGLIAESLAATVPWLLAGTRWFFDPVNIHTPGFYRVERFGERDYLYLARLDLTCRPLESEMIETGSNNRTHRYRTSRLYFESDWYPLAPVKPAIPGLPANGESGGPVVLDQIIPVTWKGESGEGYMIHGIWMDADINKFFSKLVLPPGKRNHPFYPVTCKHHCISVNALGLEPGRNGSGPAVLDSIRATLEGDLAAILEDLQSAAFSELMPLYAEIKARFPANLGAHWSNLKVSARLNEREQKEYTVEF